MRRHLPRLRVPAPAAALVALLALPGSAEAGGVYFVKEGDTLAGVGRVFRTDPDLLRRVNRIDREIRVGDRLRIPDAPLPGTAAPAPAREARLERLVCREETVYHVVERGDTLTALARRYETGVEDLLALNGLRRRSVLSLGRKLVVRRTGPKAHLVRRGDTLSLIAARTGVPVEELRRLNELADDAIAPGQRLTLEPCEGYDLAAGVPDPPPAAATATPPGLVGRVVGLARTMLDIPYRFGGTTLRGIDCSAYVQRVFGLVDTPLPRTAREQFRLGDPVPREQLSIGDLVFFRTYASFPSHVGIYLGNNLFIHASSVVRKVTIDSLERPYYVKRFIGGRRVLSGVDPDVASSAP